MARHHRPVGRRDHRHQPWGRPPAAREVGDLVLRTGRLAYHNPNWTPACSHTRCVRDPADLATAIDAATCSTASLDDLATATNAPSSLLAGAHRASMTTQQSQRRQQDQRSAPQPHPVTPVPGRTEQAPRKLHISDPALLLRAAVIEARDLVAEAAAKAHRRDTVADPGSRSVSRLQEAPGPPGRVASQDMPPAPRAGQPVKYQTGAVRPGIPSGRSRSALQRRISGPRSAERR